MYKRRYVRPASTLLSITYLGFGTVVAQIAVGDNPVNLATLPISTPATPTSTSITAITPAATFSQSALLAEPLLAPTSPIAPVNQNAVDQISAPNLTLTANALKPIAASVPLQPTLLGIYINEQEADSLDALLKTPVATQVDTPAATTDNAAPNINSTATQLADLDNYYLAINDIARLTAVEFLASTQAPQGYRIITPIGDTQLTKAQVLSHNGQDFLALSTLKQLGINATYHPQDLAIKLNMGWRPDKVLAARQAAKADAKNGAATPPVDYYPSKAGLLGLSFNSGVSINENKINQSKDNQNQQVVSDANTSRQVTADVGAYGYAFGGIWGVSGSGWQATDYRASDNQKGFASQAWTGFTDAPWHLTDWQVDNLYWAKSGDKFATRLGVNQPNGLGQGAQVSGTEFTGAMLAYSNQSIQRHVTNFDANSHSLLQNTSQDYQNLSGVAEPGGVAELRINGRAIARVQIGLDGRYEFLNLDASQFNLSATLVEIAIFAYPLAREPLEVRPIFLGQRRTNVATGELLVEAGLGQRGNVINDQFIKDNNSTNAAGNGYGYGSGNDNNNEVAAHLYAEYGLNNRLAWRGGINSGALSAADASGSRSTPLAWHTGINFIPATYSNADLSYAHSPNQDVWQAQWQYQRKKFNASYQYQARQYQASPYFTSASVNQQYSSIIPTPLPNPRNPANIALTTPPTTINKQQTQKQWQEQRHQLLLNYQPNNKTNFQLNQYYDTSPYATAYDDQPYYAYANVNHRFNDAFNMGLDWSSRDERFGYRLNWQDINRLSAQGTDAKWPTLTGHNSLSFSGSHSGNLANHQSNNQSNHQFTNQADSETLSIRHNLNERSSLGQSISHLHGVHPLLYQGDISYRLPNGFFGPFPFARQKDDGLTHADSPNQAELINQAGLAGLDTGLSSQLNVGYSLFDNHLGWRADWQLSHRNGVNFSLGYQHRYVSGIPSYGRNYADVSDLALNDLDLTGSQLGSKAAQDTPWGQENYLYARLSFELFKAPKQPLRLGRMPQQRGGSMLVDVAHAAKPALEAQTIKFILNKQAVQASLLSAQTTQSQFMIENIEPGDYTLSLDAKNLPIEYSTSELPSPKVRVSNYAPTAVPITLQKAYGIAGKLADAKEGVLVAVYQQGKLVQSMPSGSYGYFQMLGLAPDTYTLKATGYAPQDVVIVDDFVLQVELQPNKGSDTN